MNGLTIIASRLTPLLLRIASPGRYRVSIDLLANSSRVLLNLSRRINHKETATEASKTKIGSSRLRAVRPPECASIHDVLPICDAMNEESNLRGKSDAKRIVSMLTRLVQRTESVAKDRIECESSPVNRTNSPMLVSGEYVRFDPGPISRRQVIGNLRYLKWHC
jgi:hypothetical protein